MNDPVTHIARPMLPWRTDEPLTECRLDARSYPTWTREEARREAARLGKTRFYMVACVTCIQTSERYQTWDENPSSAMAREVERHSHRYGIGPDPQINLELRAIALLIESHRDEFDTLVGDLRSTVSLADARRTRTRRAR